MVQAGNTFSQAAFLYVRRSQSRHHTGNFYQIPVDPQTESQ